MHFAEALFYGDVCRKVGYFGKLAVGRIWKCAKWKVKNLEIRDSGARHIAVATMDWENKATKKPHSPNGKCGSQSQYASLFLQRHQGSSS